MLQPKDMSEAKRFIVQLEGENSILRGQLSMVNSVNLELGIVGMTGSPMWKAQVLRKAGVKFLNQSCSTSKKPND